LAVYQAGRLIFSSDSKWLHPLFELERFIQAHALVPARLVVHDKIVGRAAALLLVHIGVQQVIADLLSKLGQEVLERHKVRYEFRTLVDRVLCRTEELLADEFDPTKAYQLLASLAQRAQGGEEPRQPR